MLVAGLLSQSGRSLLEQPAVAAAAAVVAEWRSKRCVRQLK